MKAILLVLAFALSITVAQAGKRHRDHTTPPDPTTIGDPTTHKSK